MSETQDVDLCICTFRRPSVVLTLESIAAQTVRPLRIIVADNDDLPSAETLILRESARLGLACTYVHAPARNISQARNACLDAATAPLVAFIDDDETAAPTWLANLTLALRDETADIAFGPVRAVYDAAAADWLRAGDFHSTRVVVMGDGAIHTGYAGNCLMRRAAIGGERFDLQLGVSGGEDTEFFFRLHRKGARLVEAPDAIAFEPVPVTRQSLSWLLRRSFRTGQTHARTVVASGKNPLPAAGVAAVKFVYCLLAAMALALRPVAARKSLVRGALHLGATARLLGVQDVKLYGAS